MTSVLRLALAGITMSATGTRMSIRRGEFAPAPPDGAAGVRLRQPREPFMLIAQHYFSGPVLAQIVDPYELELIRHVRPSLNRRPRLDRQACFFRHLSAQSPDGDSPNATLPPGRSSARTATGVDGGFALAGDNAGANHGATMTEAAPSRSQRPPQTAEKREAELRNPARPCGGGRHSATPEGTTLFPAAGIAEPAGAGYGLTGSRCRRSRVSFLPSWAPSGPAPRATRAPARRR